MDDHHHVRANEERTRADAVLNCGDEQVVGIGRAGHTSVDRDVPLIGEEAAAAQALRALANQLETIEMKTIEFAEGHQVATAG